MHPEMAQRKGIPTNVLKRIRRWTIAQDNIAITKTKDDNLITANSWFEYKVTEKQSDLRENKTWTEKYVVTSVNGKDIDFDLYVDGKLEEKLTGNTAYGNGIIKMSGLAKNESKTIETAFGPKTVNVYKSNMCGGGVEMYMDTEGIMYQSVESQLWSMGVVFSIKRELTAFGE